MRILSDHIYYPWSMSHKISDLVQLLEKKNETLAEREKELNEKAEELEAQKEELTAAIEELVKKNNFLNATLAELQERNEELDQLVYRTSHDLKTPITSTQGLLHLLNAENPPPSIKEYAHRIGLSMQKMDDLLRSIALFTKAALDEIKLEKADLLPLVQKTWNGLNYIEGFQTIKTAWAIDANLTVYTDVRLLSEALKAVLINAIQYRNVVHATVTVSIAVREGYVDLYIEDNGDGMTPEVIEKACTIFYRGSERSTGSGLGLYMTKKIMNRLGGNVALAPLAKGLQVILSIPEGRP